jgi:hypothetical protein
VDASQSSAATTTKTSHGPLQAQSANAQSHHLPLTPAISEGQSRILRSGANAFNFSKIQVKSFNDTQWRLLAQIDKLVPDRYRTRVPGSGFRWEVLDRTIICVYEACPANLRRGLPAPSGSFRGCCHSLAALVPKTFFPTAGRPLDRFLTGVISFLEQEHINGPNTSLSRQARQRNILTPPTSSDPVPEDRAGNLSTTVSPAGVPPFHIKFESDDEVEMRQDRKSTKRKEHRSPKSKEAAPNKKRKKSNGAAGEAANPHDGEDRTRPANKKPKTQMNTTKTRKANVAAPVAKIPERFDSETSDAVLNSDAHPPKLEHEPEEDSDDSSSGSGTSSDDETSSEGDTSSEEDISSEEDTSSDNWSGGSDDDDSGLPPMPGPRNIYRMMYNDSKKEIQFLLSLLEKGAGITEDDVKACKIRVKNGYTFRYAFDMVCKPRAQTRRRPQADDA